MSMDDFRRNGPTSQIVKRIGDLERNLRKLLANPVYPGTGPVRSAIFRSTNQSIPNSSSTTVIFDTMLFDTDSMVDLVSYPTRITIKTAGIYLVCVAGFWDVNNVGNRQIGTYVKGVQSQTVGQGAAPTGRAWMGYAFLLPFSVNDYIEVWGAQTSGGPLNLLSSLPAFGTQFSPMLSVVSM